MSVFLVESGGRYLNGQPAALTCIGAREGPYIYIGCMHVNWELNGSWHERGKYEMLT